MVRCSIITDYEGLTNGFIDTTTTTGDTNMAKMARVTRPNPNVYQGNSSGYIALTSNKSSYLGITDTFSLNNNGNPVFIEINYKTNNVFTVGMENMSTGQYIPVVYIDTSSTWKKMYINLQPTIAASQSSPGYGYKIYIGASIDNDVTIGQIYLDNIKLVRYN